MCVAKVPVATYRPIVVAHIDAVFTAPAVIDHAGVRLAFPHTHLDRAIGLGNVRLAVAESSRSVMEEPQNSIHLKLLRLCRERIEVSYLVGGRKGLDVPTVLLLDLGDATARQILEAMGVTAKVDAVAADKAKQGVTTYPTVPVTAHWAGRAFNRMGFPDVQPSLNTLGGNTFGVIIVADGAVSVEGLSKPVS